MKKKKKELAKKAEKKAKKSSKVFEVMLPKGNQIELQSIARGSFRPVYYPKQDRAFEIKLIKFQGEAWGVRPMGNRKHNLHGLRMVDWARMSIKHKVGEKFFVLSGQELVKSFLSR